MTPRERLLATLRGEIPDCVPVAPDFSNMIPAKRTGKPFWDVYLYNDPPLYEAYVDCAKFFNIDSIMDGFFSPVFPHEEQASDTVCEAFLIYEDDERKVTQRRFRKDGREWWSPNATVYYRADPPTWSVPLAKLNLPDVPTAFKPIEGVKARDRGPEGFKAIKRRLGDQGIIGIYVASTSVFQTEEQVYEYYDNPDLHEQWAAERVRAMEKRFDAVMSLEEKPDFLCVGGSGSFVMQTEEMFRTVAYPAVKRAIELAHEAGMMTHIHCCGPERRLVEIMATETNLTIIDPLEIPPMGDCHLADLKARFGTKLTLKGNLHTTDVMLRGTPDEVRRAAEQAIDDGATGGRFVLSTGDQCGRDTPDENLYAMIETARTYGRYEGDTPVGTRLKRARR